MNYGAAHVFYPEVDEERCTAALLLDIDPIGLVRRQGGPKGEGFSLRQYVNDRPYVCSSFMAVALAQVFGTALSGRCKDRPELAQTQIPLEARLPVLPSRGGESLIRDLFDPLGYELEIEPLPLDERFSGWGASPYYSIVLRRTCLLRELLAQLYVLIPALDNDKHYWVARDEVEKLLRHGEGWLSTHPKKEIVTRRYLKKQHCYIRSALERLVEEETPDIEERDAAHESDEAKIEKPLSLNEQRYAATLEILREQQAGSVVDLGCGDGKFLKRLFKEKQLRRIAGLDVSHGMLQRAADRLHLDDLPDSKRARVELLHGSLTYRDGRLEDFDAAVALEVIEHLDPSRMQAFERVLFECAHPRCVILTTPNVEYNSLFEGIQAGQLRHRDHRFEWTRDEFRQWCARVAERYGYRLSVQSVGPVDDELGAPTQMGVFVRNM